jgi:hypothetical protein
MYLLVVHNQKTSISLADFPAAKLHGNQPSKVWVNHTLASAVKNPISQRALNHALVNFQAWTPVNSIWFRRGYADHKSK